MKWFIYVNAHKQFHCELSLPLMLLCLCSRWEIRHSSLVTGTPDLISQARPNTARSAPRFALPPVRMRHKDFPSEPLLLPEHTKNTNVAQNTDEYMNTTVDSQRFGKDSCSLLQSWRVANLALRTPVEATK